MDIRTISLTQGQVALVDEEDYERLSRFKWFAQYNPLLRGFYACRDSRSKQGGPTQMHRAVLNVSDSKIHVDHINHDTLDNRRANLRIATATQNKQNSKNPVGFYKRKEKKFASKPYVAYIRVNKRLLHLGYYKTSEEARRARISAELKYFGEFAPQREG